MYKVPYGKGELTFDLRSGMRGAVVESKKVPPERAKVLQDYGEKLIAEQEKQL